MSATSGKPQPDTPPRGRSQAAERIEAARRGLSAYVCRTGGDARGGAMDGVLYVARGADYLDLALASARSLRVHEPGLPIDLLSDTAPPPCAPFDRTGPLPEGAARDKIAGMAQTRFERTLFLDCDTLVLQPLGDLFAVLERVELAVCHDVRRASALIQEAGLPGIPEAFPQFNSGVLLYRRSAAMLGFLAEWEARHATLGRARDQVAFRDLLWQGDLRYHVLPPEYNLRRVTMLDAWEPLDARPKILHSHRLLQHLRGAPDRLDSLAAILPAERAALAAEWAALGLPAATPPDADPVARFTEAQARDPQAAPCPAARQRA